MPSASCCPAPISSRARGSRTLTYAGDKKITRLPQRSAIVAFSASEVYAIAELIRRQRGGAAVVLGALQPAHAQRPGRALPDGDVDFLVATDAIGMGLNLDVDHVAFAGIRKFDGQIHRNLTPAELGQIAGRAGRHMNDGTFGVTGAGRAVRERHDRAARERTPSIRVRRAAMAQSRARFRSLDRLRDSLRETPDIARLARARMADDVIALETVSRDRGRCAHGQRAAPQSRCCGRCARSPTTARSRRQNHAELVATLYKFLMSDEERIPDDWFAKQVALADRTDGDIDTLANRIAHIRTWTFVSNRADWLEDPEHWQDARAPSRTACRTRCTSA